LLTRVSVQISDLEAWLWVKVFQVVMSANQREIRQENTSNVVFKRLNKKQLKDEPSPASDCLVQLVLIK
jgi:hypothetical protein